VAVLSDEVVEALACARHVDSFLAGVSVLETLAGLYWFYSKMGR
jgi:hypothetical protein